MRRKLGKDKPTIQKFPLLQFSSHTRKESRKNKIHQYGKSPNDSANEDSFGTYERENLTNDKSS